MKKNLNNLIHKRKKTVRWLSVLLISFFFQVFLLEVTVHYFPRYNKQPGYYLGTESFDPSLSRLNSINTLIDFCDSLNGGQKIKPTDSAQYANMVARVIRYRFVHGYTWYHLGHNYVATLLAPMVHSDLSAIVVPDDILKYPKAACSQQSIIGMKVLKDKGYLVRKIGFYDSIYEGHFCYEVKYGEKWHFYDPNREPDENVLNQHDRPSIKDLNENTALLLSAYKRDSAKFVLALYSTYKYGKSGVIPGRNAMLFQTVTSILSFTLWIFLALLYFYFERKFSLGNKKKRDISQPA